MSQLVMITNKELRRMIQPSLEPKRKLEIATTTITVGVGPSTPLPEGQWSAPADYDRPVKAADVTSILAGSTVWSATFSLPADHPMVIGVDVGALP